MNESASVQISNVRNIRDIVYDNLRKAILEGELKPGERIIEKEYADKLKISRTPVREALRKLEIEGLLEHIPRKGDVVKTFDKKEIVEVYAIRRALELLALEYIIEYITPEEISLLQKMLAQLEMCQDQGEIGQVMEVSKRFNEILLQSAKMPKLTGMINSLKEYLNRYRSITLAQANRRDMALSEHKEILQAVVNHDLKRAQDSVLTHLRNSQEELMRCLEG